MYLYFPVHVDALQATEYKEAVDAGKPAKPLVHLLTPAITFFTFDR